MTYLDKTWRMTLFYNVVLSGVTVDHVHHVYVNVDNGDEPGNTMDVYEVQRRNGSIVTADVIWDEYQDLIEPLFANTANFVRIELWAADAGSNDFVFYSTLPIGHVGSGVGTNQAGIGQIITMRSVDGKSGRLQYMENQMLAGAKDPYPFSNTPSANIAAYITGLTSFIYSKNRAWFIAPINNCVEQNEKIWDKRFRTS